MERVVEVSSVYDRPGVYNILMARMSYKKERLTNIRMYGSICSRCRNVSHPELGGLWGKVKIVVMKYPAVLQAQPSRQGQRIGLKVYMQR